MAIASSFSKGRQPCGNFVGNYETHWHGLSVHCCLWCSEALTETDRENGKECRTVSFCGNCHRDHHEGGYETCARQPKSTPADAGEGEGGCG